MAEYLIVIVDRGARNGDCVHGHPFIIKSAIDPHNIDYSELISKVVDMSEYQLSSFNSESGLVIEIFDMDKVNRIEV